MSRWQHASTGHSFLLLGGLAATLFAAQGFLLFPLVITDPRMAELPNGVSLKDTFWILRALTIVMAPVLLGLRVLAVSILLHSVLALWGAESRWRSLLRGVLRAEGFFLAESACATMLLFWHSPATLQAAEALTLRSGLDLLWQPASASLTSLLVAANIFALLWTMQIYSVLRQATNLSCTGSRGLSILFGMLLVVVRTVSLQM